MPRYPVALKNHGDPKTWIRILEESGLKAEIVDTPDGPLVVSSECGCTPLGAAWNLSVVVRLAHDGRDFSIWPVPFSNHPIDQ